MTMTGNELLAVRRRLGWTQAQLAEAVGVAPNTVARWERGELSMREPAVRLVRLLAAQNAPAKKKRGK